LKQTLRLKEDSTRAASANRWIGPSFIVISGIAFGALPIFARLAYAAGASPTTVLLLRFALAGGVMVLVMVARREPFPRGRILLGLVLMGGLGYVGQSFAYFTALTMASAGLVALLLYLYPAIVTLLAALLFKERLTLTKLGAVLLALVGTVLTIGPTGSGRTLGILLGIASAVIYSIYILAGSRIMPRAGSIPSSTIVMIAASVVFGGIVAVHGPAFPVTLLGWIAIAAIALISTVLAIVAFFAGLERIGPSRSSTISTVEPLVSVTLAALVLGENLHTLQMVGGALIVIAAVICSLA
jgi:drug/metabolite transporter (DMT)-like permease